MYADIVTAIYSAVIGYMSTNYATVPVALENGPFDYSNPPSEYILVEVKFYSGDQIGMSEAPKTRASGYVYVTYHCKEGEGVMRGLNLLNDVAEVLAYSKRGRAILRAASLGDESPPPGWHTDMIKVPFYADAP